ncbi:MAG: FtsQ-type POTRA domain-containing protein, partial [Chitinivibrionales bacterium]|nr:FtsQ-type POTRA domain-containing protein [Chitinivibrionales bacterium]MBD3356007.1 FtsQ-type POTRA domain-containing protein [Chitinivibrionales bacterium]
MAKRVGANHRRKAAGKRAKRARRKVGRTIVKVVGALTLTALVLYAAKIGVQKAITMAARAELFKIDKVVVKGTDQLDDVQVLAEAAIDTGASMLRLKVSEVRERLCRNVRVSRVKIMRLPPGKVTVRITERKPIALVNLGAVYQVDADGVLLPLTRGLCANVPLFTGLRDT